MKWYEIHFLNPNVYPLYSIDYCLSYAKLNFVQSVSSKLQHQLKDGFLIFGFAFGASRVRVARKVEMLGWKLNFVVWTLFWLFWNQLIWFLCYWGGWLKPKIRGRGKIKFEPLLIFNKKDIQKDGLRENRF